MSTSHTPAEHLRECILHVLAAAKAPLTSAEIYDQIDSAESRQAVAAQINYLKKSGEIDSWQTDAGVMRHALVAHSTAETGDNQPDLARRLRIQHAIDSMRAIGLDEIRAMTDEELADFRDAMSGPWMMTKSDLYRRADTDWPDALETAA